MNHLMKYFYDTEFLENGRTIELISIGIVAEDGREYYAVNAEVNEDGDEQSLGRRIARHDWLMENVVVHLPLRTEVSRYTSGARNHMPPHLDLRDVQVKPKWVIANEVREFLLATDGESDEIELWADYAAYDHVVLMQLWGPMINRPSRLPMWTHDLQFEAKRLGVPHSQFPQREGAEMTEHHALGDARADKMLFDFLYERMREQMTS